MKGKNIKHRKYKTMDNPPGHLSTSHNNSHACHLLTTNFEQ